MFCPECRAIVNEQAKFCVNCGTSLQGVWQAPAHPLPSTPPIGLPQPAAAADGVKYAGFWHRFAAALLDLVFSQITAVLLVLPLAFVAGLLAALSGEYADYEIEALGENIGLIVGMVVQWLWFTLGESSSWQASVGKKLVGLKVTNGNGERIGFGRANARYWSKILSGIILLIGYLMAAFTEKKQALHDMIADTLVLRAD